MDPDRWLRIQDLYLEAADLAPTDRRVFLDEACAGDAELRREVESLLEADAAADPLLDATLDDLIGLVDAGSAGSTPAPERAGPYRLGAEVGYGGMGTVYRAERDDGRYSRTVALKILRAGLPESAVRRFRREQQILAGLEHPHIARLYDAGVTDDGRPYLGMELVEGEPIHRYCERHRLDVAARLRLFEQVCAAVDYAHRKLIIHRDLKPSNILVAEGGVVKLLDFGIAKLLDVDADVDAWGEPLTRAQQRVLTPEYASPEQLRGEELGTASDVFALGMVLHRLLTGRTPRRSADGGPETAPSTVVDRPTAEAGPEGATAETLARELGATPAELKRLLRGEVDALVMKATHPDPEERYPTAAALLDDLHRYRQGRPLRARPPTLAYRMRKFVVRNRWAVSTAAAFVVLLGASSVALAREQAETARERDRARAEAEKALRIRDFMTSIFDAANPSTARGDSITAREVLDRSAERIDEEMADQPEVRADLLVAMSHAYRALGLVPESADFLERALTVRREFPGDSALALAEVLNELGRSYETLDLFEEAESAYREALELRTAAFGPTHTLVSQSMLSLGLLYTYTGELDQAEPLLRGAVELDRALMVGDTSGPLGYSLNNLAVLRFNQGDVDEAADLLEESLEIRRATYGPFHPRVSNTLGNLAALLSIMGDHERAIPVLEDVLEMNRRLFGEDHPDMATAYHNLGAALNAVGRLDEAEPLLLSSLELNRRLLGEENREVILTLNELSHLEAARGDLEAALAHAREGRSLSRRVLGPEHVRTAVLTQTVAARLELMGRCDEAEPTYREALTIYAFSQPDDGHYMADARAGLAGCLLSRGAYDEAEELLLRAYPALRQERGDDDRRTERARQRLVELYTALGRPDRAAAYQDAPTG